MIQKHILVVDDAATVRMYHRRTLGDAGWLVDEAINGMDALEKMAQHPDNHYHLVVSDINMPRMDGYAFVRALRSRLDTTWDVPVLMVSTEAKTCDKEAAFAAGANAYLIKPAKSAELVLTVALMLGETSTAQQAAAQTAHNSKRGPGNRPTGR